MSASKKDARILVYSTSGAKRGKRPQSTFVQIGRGFSCASSRCHCPTPAHGTIMLKRIIKSALRHGGDQLRKAAPPAPIAVAAPAAPVDDAFSVQRELIRADEPLIFDVGAHHGSVARHAAGRLFPGTLIHCFEPFPDSFNILSENLKGDSRIHCHQTALSSVAGLAVLNANLSSQTNLLLPTDPSGAVIWGGGLLDTTGKVEVAVTTVDHFVRDNKIAHIDILKLDVQGAEYALFLRGDRNAEAAKGFGNLYGVDSGPHLRRSAQAALISAAARCLRLSAS